jgi:CRP-like cAMP-binding protein
MKAVPLFQALPESEQKEMYSLLQHQEFEDGQYIVTQGDLGTTAYIITDGAVDVIEDIMVDGTMEHNLLTRLYQGHVFGELSLIYDEPRVANVVSVGHTCCLCVTKDVFLAALSGKQFNEVMQQIAYKRAMTRENRNIRLKITKRIQQDKNLSHVAYLRTMSSTSTDITDKSTISTKQRACSFSSSRNNSICSSSLTCASEDDRNTSFDDSRSNYNTDTSEIDKNVFIQSHLKIKKSKNGTKKSVNNYDILKLIGKGTYGEVYLGCDKNNVRDNTEHQVAIKVMIRYLLIITRYISIIFLLLLY